MVDSTELGRVNVFGLVDIVALTSVSLEAEQTSAENFIQPISPPQCLETSSKPVDMLLMYYSIIF